MHSPVAAVRLGAAYNRDACPAVVKEMIIALIKDDNLAGLSDQIDLLKDRLEWQQ